MRLLRHYKYYLSIIGLSFIISPKKIYAAIIDGGNPDNPWEVISYIDRNIRPYLEAVAGFVIFWAFVYSIILYMSARGEPEKLNNAKKALIATFVGLALFVMAEIAVRVYAQLLGGAVRS